MITSSIVFALSGLFAAYMFWSRRDALDEHVDGLIGDDVSMGEGLARKSLASLGISACQSDLDIRLRAMYQGVIAWFRAIDGKYLKDRMHDIAEYVEKKGLAMLSRILNRFGKVRDIVTGKDLPKNKGSVSFFLKHMVHHKSQIGPYMPDADEGTEGNLAGTASQGRGVRTLDPRLQKKLEINRK